MAKYQIEIPVFDGGLNTKNNPSSLPLNQSPDLLNVVFDDFGAVGTRNGTSSVIGSLGYGTVIDGLTSYKMENGTSFLVAAGGGNIYALNVTAWNNVTVNEGRYVTTPNNDVSFLQVNNRLVFSDGINQVYKWDGSLGAYNITQFGVPVVTNNATVSNGGTGVVGIGLYSYVFTGVNSGLSEGDYGSATTLYALPDNRQLFIDNIPVFPASAGVNYVNVYRTKADGSSVFYLTTSVVNGTTSLYDNVNDSDLVSLAPTDNGQIPRCKYLCQYGAFMFAAGDSNHPNWLYFSKAGDFEVWPSTNYLKIGEGDGYPITGIMPFGNSIIIHKNDDNGNGAIYLLYMPDSTTVDSSDNWYVIKSPSQWSGQSSKAITGFNNLQAFFNKNGMYALSGQDLALGAANDNHGRFQADSHSFDIEPTILKANQKLLKKSAAITYKNKIWFSYADGLTGYNNKILQYDYVRNSDSDRNIGAWSLFDNHFANNFAIHGGELYAGSSRPDGIIYKLDVGKSDSLGYTGSSYPKYPIQSYFTTSAISGAPEHKDCQKIWRWIYIWVECYGSFNMSLTYFLDYKIGNGITHSVNLSSGGSNWGEFTWGRNVWGGGLQRKKIKVGLDGAGSKDIQFKFSSLDTTNNYYWKVHKIQVVYNLRSMR